jgi:hypothetical protein
MFCEGHQKFAKLPRHLRSCHKTEPKVLELERAKGAEKAKFYHLIRNQGDFNFNLAVMKGEKPLEEFMTQYASVARPISDYVPCKDCLGWNIKSEVYRHHCPATPSSKPSDDCLKRSTFFFCGLVSASTGSQSLDQAFSQMKRDHITLAARNDPLIVAYAKTMILKRHSFGTEK